MRTLAARAVGSLVSLHPEEAVQQLRDMLPMCQSQQLPIRHGALLTASELLLSLSVALPQLRTLDVCGEIANLVPALDKARMYR